MLRDLMARLGSWAHASRLYASSLFEAVPRQLSHLSPMPMPGDPRRGQQIVGGVLLCAGHKFGTPNPKWFDPAASPDAIRSLHDFRYLADLAAAGVAGHHRATELISSWRASGSDRRDLSWAPDVLGARIAAWLTYSQYLPTDPSGSAQVLRSLVEQVRYLSRTVASGRAGVARLVAIKGLVYGATCGLAPAYVLQRALKILRHELKSQILPDGVHIERSPAVQFQALTTLIDIQGMLEASGHAVPADLAGSIAVVAPILRLFRHGDGGLALFNGSHAGTATDIDILLLRSKSEEPSPAAAPQGGFQRALCNTTLVVQDVGRPPPPGLDADAHAGCLSFEMSSGPERLVVNCGTTIGPLHDALRATAAHSTLVVGDVNSAEVLKGGGLGRRPVNVDCMREEQDGSVWITASHDGYRDRFGLLHRRRLYLAAAGDNLRGEDSLISAGSDSVAAQGLTLHFHLHPDVQASLMQNGVAVLLRLPSGTGWRFQSGGGMPRLEDSIYCGDESSRRTQRIAIETSTQNTEVVKWAFQRLASKS